MPSHLIKNCIFANIQIIMTDHLAIDQLKSFLLNKINSKTKPLGSLGQLEELALKIGMVQNTLTPKLSKPAMIVFAGDHGAAQNSGISPYPQEVTHQMVLNFLSGGAAINVFSRQNEFNLQVVDAGVNHDFGSIEGLINRKVNYGTKDYCIEKAMSVDELNLALQFGAELVDHIFQQGCNVIGFGEMGIGNTSSAALLMHCFTQIPLTDCIGKGTGLDNEGLKRKQDILEKALQFHQPLSCWEDILRTFSGFEIAMITGAMLQAASHQMIILLDGFIASASYLAAFSKNPEVKNFVIACHQSDEKGHKHLLNYLDLKPLLNLQMRLGEGTGAVLAYPLIQAAVNFLNEMNSFEGAGVSSLK